MFCRCDPTRGQACRWCDGTDPRISLAEDLRDYGCADPDAWRPALNAYERHIYGDHL